MCGNLFQCSPFGEGTFVILATFEVEHQMFQLHVLRLVLWEEGLYLEQAAKGRSKCPLYTDPVLR